LAAVELSMVIVPPSPDLEVARFRVQSYGNPEFYWYGGGHQAFELVDAARGF
jgi:hypothetical protein